MHRIDSPGNDNGEFVDQDLNNNQPGSNTNAAWLNAIQNELVSVVEGAGLTLEKTDQTQFWQAIQKTLQTNLVPVYAYADSITGANLSLSTLANNIYTPPNTVGKTHIGIVQIKPGADVPASAGEYSWREREGKIRIRLDTLTAPTVSPQTLTLSQSLRNFDYIEVATFEAHTQDAQSGTNFDKYPLDIVLTSSSNRTELLNTAGATDNSFTWYRVSDTSIALSTFLNRGQFAGIWGIR